MRLDRRILGLFAAAILAIVALAAASPAHAHAGSHGASSPHRSQAARPVSEVARHASGEAGAVAQDGLRARPADLAPVALRADGSGSRLDAAGCACCPGGCRNACCGVACPVAGILPQAGLDLPPPTAGALRPRRDATARATASPEALPEPPRRGA